LFAALHPVHDARIAGEVILVIGIVIGAVIFGITGFLAGRHHGKKIARREAR
jgi:hypothetical protein